MAATTCAYGYGSSCPPSAPAPAAMASPTAARSLQAMDSFSHHSHSHSHAVLGSIIHGVVMPPPPAPPPPPLPPPPLLDLHSGTRSGHSGSQAASRDPGLCTEGLGSESSESSGDVDLGDVGDDNIEEMEAEQALHHQEETTVMARARGGSVFPPPISVIGAAGKPWQYLRAHRGDGRLVLREVRIPSRELLQACREDGRLKLHFAHPDDQENN
ncbi:hypothetical protein ACQ4PT_008631 [Festuca glaucescens]